MKPNDPSDDRLERLLGDSPELGVSEKESILAAVLEQTAPRPARRPGFVGWLALAATSLAVIVLVAFFPRERDDELTPRGGALGPAFSLSCLVNGAAGPCEVGAKLVFTVSPRDARSFAAVAESPDGTTVWLFPSAPGGSSLDLSTLGAGGVVPEGVLLDGPPGSWIVHGVFAGRPLSRDELRAALEAPASFDGVIVRQELQVR